MMQSNQSSYNSIVFLRSDRASIFITPRHLDRQRSADTVVQMFVSINFISGCTFGSTALIAVRL